MDGSVTVNVYVPAAFTEGVAVFAPETIPGPLQLNVAPPVADEPLSVTEGAEQVNVCVFPAFASGAAEFEFTTTCEGAEHPFDGSVTVSVYVPAVFTVGVAVFPPETIPGPPQLNVAPLVEEEPFSATEEAAQVNVWAVPAFAFGAAVFEFTTTCEGAVHPFAGSVTVNVYVPAVFTVGVAVLPPETIPGPDQLNVAPLVEEEPFRLTVTAEQLNVCEVPAFAFGAVVFEFTIACAVAVHPFAGSETVTVYVPAAFTVGVAVFPPEIIPGPVQLNVAPPVEEEPFMLTVVAEQLNVCEDPAFAFGAVVFEFTIAWAVAVHPFDGSETVTVYVPAVLTVGVAVFPPETIPGPAQLNVVPPVEEEPFKITEDEEQLIVCVPPPFAFGAVLFAVTATWSVAEHPLPGSVTVNVYDPAAFTVGVVLFPPEVIPGPAQL